MKALTWHGKGDIRCESVPDPTIQHSRDAIIKVTSCAICGSDLHLFNGVMPKMESGDVLGHETMGEVVEVGADNKKLKVGDRVVVPFTISCGECFFCRADFLGCERTNPDKKTAEKLWVIRRRGCSDTPTFSAAIAAAKQNICACLMQTWGQSRCRKA